MNPEFQDNTDLENNIKHLEIARIIEVRQKMGESTTDKRLCCKIEMSNGGILDNVPFVAGGIDPDTKFPHGIFVLPRVEQMVGVLFARGNAQNPIACFSIPHPSWLYNQEEAKQYFGDIMEDIDDITLFHFSGSRIHLRKDGTIEFANKISSTSYGINIKIESTNSKKTITDLDNNNMIVIDSNGIKITDKNNNVIEMNSAQIIINTHLTVDR